ncbi:MAG: DUF4159 domain-containing protein [Calditrichaceae bacterium]|nr:DUF4159 domain-containing protein [Calditrichaceae bacterium]MBN2709351.1 DUF4159 domain-containing protein [Calditrichaceae bacterium]RQV94685.1 MAG: DUF4159 domain-containing protein [Calditrichota bacterium]
MFKYVFIVLILFSFLKAQPVQPVRIHYDGGGDWYGNKTTWSNILKKARAEGGINTAEREISLKITDTEFKQYPIAYIAGHGNIAFSEQEVEVLRQYLISGGFLFADDDYGMDKSFRREMKKVFPELEFVELPFAHPIYNTFYKFDAGLPKVHEHDGGSPKGFGLIYKGRLICFYSFNTDISDGCEDQNIHNDPPAIREKALQMAVNILIYALLN